MTNPRTIQDNFLIFNVESSIFFSDNNNYGPMGDEQIRPFKLNLKHKPTCRLVNENIKIRKTAVGNLGLNTFELVDYLGFAYIECLPGYVQRLQAIGITEGCGIGKILMRLCLNEKHKHDVAYNEQNQAINHILEWIERCKRRLDKVTCPLQFQKKLAKLEKWATTECSKMVTLYMAAVPKSGAYVYFNSAMESNYSQMIVQISSVEIYPKDGPSSVETLKGQYNGEGEMDNGQAKVPVFNSYWYFCFPLHQ